jgi:hypothetical protein
LRTIEDRKARLDVDVHTSGFEELNKRPVPWKDYMDFVPVLREATEHALQATAGAVEIGRVVNRENIHL